MTPETPGDKGTEGGDKKDFIPTTPVPGDKKPAAASKKEEGKKDAGKS
jgi:hypothetical protein